MNTTWNCEVSGIPTEGLTVGQAFDLKCAGSEAAGFNPQAMSLELPKADKFRLRILETKTATASSIEAVVTSYVPGDTSLKDVVLTDGTNRISLDGVNFLVKSVIKEGEEPKPFPPEAPVSMMWPAWVLVTIVLTVLAILLGVAFLIQRRRNAAKFKAWLVKIKTPLSPFDQLNKDLRYALKERDPEKQIGALETATRTYLARTFESPLMAASSKQVLKVITGGDKKAHARLQPLTIRLFGEFERVASDLAKSRLAKDEALNVTLPQVHELVREFGEAVNSENQRRGRMGGRAKGGAA